MSDKDPSQTKQRLDALIRSYPVGEEHTEPTRAMLEDASCACNGAPDKIQAVSDAVGSIAYFLAMVHRGEPERIANAVSKAVEAGIKEHVAACALLAAAQERARPSAPDSKQDVWTMIATSIAANMKTVIICTFAALCVISFMLILSGQIKEAAGAGVSISQAVKDFQR